MVSYSLVSSQVSGVKGFQRRRSGYEGEAWILVPLRLNKKLSLPPDLMIDPRWGEENEADFFLFDDGQDDQ